MSELDWVSACIQLVNDQKWQEGHKTDRPQIKILASILLILKNNSFLNSI